MVAIPTETVYGLAGNALEANVVTKIFAAKDRPLFDPLIVHIPSFEVAKHYVGEIPPQANELANHFWPGPLTLLLTKKDSFLTSSLRGLTVWPLDAPIIH